MQTPLLYDPDDPESYAPRSPFLERFNPRLRSEEQTPCEAVASGSTSEAEDSDEGQYEPGNEALLMNLAPNYPDLHRVPLPRVTYGSDIAMTSHFKIEESTKPPSVSAFPAEQSSKSNFLGQSGGVIDATALKAKASAAVLAHETAAQGLSNCGKDGPGARHDSAHDQGPDLPQDGRCQTPPLTLQTRRLPTDSKSVEDLVASPTSSRHVAATSAILPALQPTSSPQQGDSSSPQAQKLPGIHQVLRPIDVLAESASQMNSQGGSTHHHSHSFGSASAHSPTLPFYPGPHASSPYFISATTRSPTSAMSDHTYNSPPQFSHTTYYSGRRTSGPSDRHPPNLPPSLPSASSSGESHGTTSSADGYSTSQTTPSEASDVTARPILPPPPGMPQHAVVTSQGFQCDYPGCTALPFQTQYLLSSHRNVHSQSRPHYCPVKECPRSEGGKGFKRKNEMIRHGLVHDSPGYMCPFCPEREHRYPRPDNLQRHVRVHHVDKDRDDPLLRDVLAQRREGMGKTRRRRANTAESVG